MIRKLTKSDNSKVMEYLKEESSFNLFIIGDIENFGYDSGIQDLWAEFDETDNIKGVLLRYRNHYIPYSKGEFNASEFANIIRSNDNFQVLSGKRDIVQMFENELEFGKKRSQYFSELKRQKNLNIDVDLSETQKATEDDVDLIVGLREVIEEFDPDPSAREIFLETLKTNSGRTYFIKRDGMAVACASTSAENSESAMVVGVCTHPDYRKQGLATKCLIALCKEVLDEGRKLCLFYDNPDAGRIYKRIGFEDIGRWAMYSARK